MADCAEAQEDICARWRPIHILGKEKTFYSAHDGGVGTAMNRSCLPIVGGWGEARGLNEIAWFNRYVPEDRRFDRLTYISKGKQCRRSYPYTVWDTMGPEYDFNHAREDFRKLHATRPDVPFLLKGFHDSWFPWFMKDKYDCDTASYLDFCKTYTNFIAIVTLNESDGGFWGFDSQKSITNLQMRAEIDAAFPPAKCYRDRVEWMKRAMERQKAMYFGADRFYSLYSGNCKWGHVLAKYGIAMLGYECESQVLSGPWRYSMAHVRGAGRQYRIPWTWYAAHLIRSYTRDGKSFVDDEWHLPNRWKSRTKWPKSYHEDCGTARSIIKRAMAYGYFAGANVIALENPQYFLFDDEKEAGRLSKYGRDFEEVMQMSERTPRGFCYTPVAALTGVYEKFSRCGGNDFGTDAFFFTLVPTLTENGYTNRDEKKGDQGILFNSEFGEIADVLTPDAAQKPGDFAAALKPYRWAFMMGKYDENDFERAAVEAWVKAGGTLVTSVDYVGGGHAGRVTLPADGRGTRPACPLVSTDLAGVDFTTNVVRSGEKLIETATGREAAGDLRQPFRCVAYGGRVVEALLDYELHVATPTTARPLYSDEKGQTVVWENACGKGTVITLAARQGLPRQLAERKKYYKELNCNDYYGVHFQVAAGRLTYPIQRELLRKCQRETMPVEVEGDIQWGVNKVEKRGGGGEWLVWLLNNKGVKKFAYEDDDIDHAFDAKVKITNKKTGKVVEVVVPAGGYASVSL